MKTIAFTSTRKGVGKSTIAMNLSFALKALGKNPLLVDCDLSILKSKYAVTALYKPFTLEDFFYRRMEMEEIINSFEGLNYVLCCNKIENLIHCNPSRFEEAFEEFRINGFDVVIFDSVAGFDGYSENILQVSKEFMFVTIPQKVTMDELMSFVETMRSLFEKKNGIVLNMVNSNSPFSDEALELMTGSKIIGKIPYDKNVEEAERRGEFVIKYNPMAPASISILRLAGEILGKKIKFSFFKQLFYKIFGLGGKEEYEELIRSVIQ